jgi:hypothetical protein
LDVSRDLIEGEISSTLVEGLGVSVVNSSQEPPFKQESHSCGYAEDEKKNWQLLGDRVTSSRDPDPHVDASDDEPERNVSDGRQARGIGIVWREELCQQEKRSQEQESCDKE